MARDGDKGVGDAIGRGSEYWRQRFFELSGAPKYYDDKAAPYDIHSAATAVEAAARLQEVGIDLTSLANDVSAWTRDHLVAPDGTTYYRSHRLWTDRRHFVRWGDGHWAVSLATLSCEANTAGFRWCARSPGDWRRARCAASLTEHEAASSD